MARRYLAAFGPASIDDFAAYVGRGKGGIGVWRTAVADLSDEVVSLSADDGRALVDLAAWYRDVLAVQLGARVEPGATVSAASGVS